MNAQGIISRKDVVWIGVIMWFMISWYPFLSVAMIVGLLISTYWEATSSRMGVVVNLFKGKVTAEAAGGASDGKGKNYKANLSQTTIKEQESVKSEKNIKETV